MAAIILSVFALESTYPSPPCAEEVIIENLYILQVKTTNLLGMDKFTINSDLKVSSDPRCALPTLIPHHTVKYNK